MAAVHGDIYVELFAFVVNLISLNKRLNKHSFEISQVVDTFTWSHQFILITRYRFYLIYFRLVCSSFMIKHFVKIFSK